MRWAEPLWYNEDPERNLVDKVQSPLGALYPGLALSKSQLSFPWLRYMSTEFSTPSLPVSACHSPRSPGEYRLAHFFESKVECSWVAGQIKSGRWDRPLFYPRYLEKHMNIVVILTLVSLACCYKWKQQYYYYYYTTGTRGNSKPLGSLCMSAAWSQGKLNIAAFSGNKTEFLGIALCTPGLITEFHRSRYSGRLLFNVLAALFQVCSV